MANEGGFSGGGAGTFPASVLVASFGKKRRSNRRVSIDLALGAEDYRDVDA